MRRVVVHKFIRISPSCLNYLHEKHPRRYLWIYYLIYFCLRVHFVLLIVSIMYNKLFGNRRFASSSRSTSSTGKPFINAAAAAAGISFFSLFFGWNLIWYLVVGGKKTKAYTGLVFLKWCKESTDSCESTVQFPFKKSCAPKEASNWKNCKPNDQKLKMQMVSLGPNYLPTTCNNL